MVNRTKIAVVTFAFGTNYGCHLQRCALVRMLRTLGYEADTISFVPVRSVWKSKIRSVVGIRLYEVLIKIVQYIRNPKSIFVDLSNLFLCPSNKRSRLFKKFELEYCPSTETFVSYTKMQTVCNKRYNVFIAGSDQIWNPNFRLDQRYYMLDFAPTNKKISYAASVGVSKITKENEETFRSLLKDFQWISVRETDGASELERILDRKVEVVLDPTLLLDATEWKKVGLSNVLNTRLPERYVLFYSLAKEDFLFDKLREVQEFLKIPVVYICKNRYEKVVAKQTFNDAVPLLNVGPSEFAYLFSKASCIVTNSFHGSVFSILFHKPFFTVVHNDTETKTMNSRMTTLFSAFHLESRLCSPDNNPPLTQESFVIDYEEVERQLRKHRSESIAKLQRAIENVVKENTFA